ncbi:ABC transporter permease subunit [Cryptosporangium phraense]|uniref:ABC transporter permease subunit n=1 Tax=Cryptosporangium phraense TaxID=2593070 RepID=A0A545AXG5_9ACTN|nr:ABC transporter permease subunit [Cryptosporangium phraense]TQS46026.1 ABC transporter permease subunit [Cryptosporangium phraense]
MIWLSWRQFRASAIVGGLALGLAAVGLIVLGLTIRQDPYVDCTANCAPLAAEFADKYVNLLYFVDAGLLLLPPILGIFWGAPLIARELETGTHRLVWNQSVTRYRWLAVKLLVVGLAAVVAAGVVSGLLTWAASPYDAVAGDRFTGLIFGLRNLAPLGYALFAFLLGTTLGLLLRRTLPAMALTGLLVIVVQILVPTTIRPHFRTPVASEVPMTAGVVANLSFLGADADISGLKIPGALVVSTSRLLGRDGRVVDLDRYHECVSRSPETAPACIEKLDLHVRVTYQPPGRYWTFQVIEVTLYCALAALLAGLAFRRIRPRR